MWPARPWKHSCSASDRVGWVCTLRASSLAVRSHFCASVSSGRSSDDVGADEVAAEQFAVLGVGDQLDEPGRVAEAVRLAVGGERELRDLDVVALVAGLRLGQAEAGDLRLTERRAGHHPVVAERQGLRAGDGLGRHHTLRLGDVGQLQLARDVADRVDVRHVGAHVVVDADAPCARSAPHRPCPARSPRRWARNRWPASPCRP